MAEEPLSPRERMRITCELFESGVELMRQNLRRRHPEEDARQIEARLVQWLQTRPGAEHGDAQGRPRDPAEPAA